MTQSHTKMLSSSKEPFFKGYCVALNRCVRYVHSTAAKTGISTQGGDTQEEVDFAGGYIQVRGNYSNLYQGSYVIQGRGFTLFRYLA